MASITTELRQSINETVRAAAAHALQHPEDEAAERLRILGMLLDPQLDVVERAIRSYERSNPFSTTERERIASYVTRTIDRKVLGGPQPGDAVELGTLAAGVPLAWVTRFARACIVHGVTEVRRERARATSASVDGGMWFPSVDSAEDAYLQQQHVDVVEAVADVVDSWHGKPMTVQEKQREIADALRALRGVPPLHVRSGEERRWVLRLLETDAGTDAIIESLIAFRDLASGNPKWEQIHVDERLLDLWIDFTAEQAESLASSGRSIVLAIVRGAVTFPSQPQEAQRVAVRRVVKGMSSASGWSSLVMELERSWVGAYFGPRVGRDNWDRRSDEVAEADRQRAAAGWTRAARSALEFPGQPLGPAVRTVEDVADWLATVLRVVAD